MVECRQSIENPDITRINVSWPDKGRVMEVQAVAEHGCGYANEADITVRNESFSDYSGRKEFRCEFPPKPISKDLCPTYPRYPTYDLMWRAEKMWEEISGRFTVPQLYNELREPTQMFMIKGRHDAAWKLEGGYLILIDAPIRGRPVDGVVDRIEYITRFDETEGERSVTYVIDPQIVPAAQALFNQSPHRVTPKHLLTVQTGSQEFSSYIAGLGVATLFVVGILIAGSQTEAPLSAQNR